DQPTTPTESPAAPLPALAAAAPAPSAPAAPAPTPTPRRGGRPGNSGGKKGRSGPPGNRNAAKSGIYALGSYPKGASYVRRLVGQLKMALENAVQARHGEISLTRAGAIQTACRHEAVAMLAQRWLRLRFKKMGDSDRLNYLKQIATASEARDKAMRSLELEGQEHRSIINLLYGQNGRPPIDVPQAPKTLPAVDGPQPSATAGETSGGSTEAVAGNQDSGHSTSPASNAEIPGGEI
ncbi:MAG: hypothetical protein AB7I37_26360, partial [Pirellulales bacterium]